MQPMPEDWSRAVAVVAQEVAYLLATRGEAGPVNHADHRAYLEGLGGDFDPDGLGTS